MEELLGIGIPTALAYFKGSGAIIDPPLGAIAAAVAFYTDFLHNYR